MKKQTAMHHLILEKLSILFNAEKQLVNYLQVIKNKCQNPALQSLLNVMIEVSFSRISRLNQIFVNLKRQPQGATCEAMNGLIRENLSLLSLNNDRRAKELTIVSFLHQQNHYKFTAYTWLQAHIYEVPQLMQAGSLIQNILHEESSMGNQITEVENNLLFLAHFREQLMSF